MQNKLIIYELNEVSKKILNLYIKLRPKSAISELCSSGIFFDTITHDNGELHPWSTWPTVHRGVNNFKHDIRNINQDLTTSAEFKPIWELLLEKNIDIGIFGSLQSYPPIKSEYTKFYLPDTFAPKSTAIPEKLESFQDFNLEIVQENKAISSGFSKNTLLKFLKAIYISKLSKRSLFKVLMHVLKERFDNRYKTRRANLQPILSFDLFFRELKSKKPSFTTFFTNHVAGMMHRYWVHLFPSDYELRSQKIDEFYKESIINSLDIADGQIKKLKIFAKENNYDLWIISSMGQDSIKLNQRRNELLLNKIDQLLKILNLEEKNYKLLPAMQPQICFDCRDKNSLDILKINLSQIRNYKKDLVFQECYSQDSLRLTYTINAQSDSLKEKIFFKENILDYQELGFELINRHQLSAYHIPEGIFIGQGNFCEKYFSNIKSLDTISFAPWICKMFNIKKPEYMCNV